MRQEDYDKLSILKVYLWSNLLIVLYNLLALIKVIVNVHLRRQTELENERLVSYLIIIYSGKYPELNFFPLRLSISMFVLFFTRYVCYLIQNIKGVFWIF